MIQNKYWIKTSLREPHSGEDVIAMYHGGEDDNVYIQIAFMHSNGKWYYPVGTEIAAPDYWIPMPQFP